MLVRRRYGIPLVLVVLALLLTGTLVGGHFVVHRRTTTATRAAGVLPSPAPLVAALDGPAALAATPTPRGLLRALDPLLRAPALAPGLVGSVVDATTGQQAYALNANSAVPPASTTKLVTAAAALSWLGPDTTFRTRIVLATMAGARPTVTVIGGGDPTLASQRAAPSPYPPVAQLGPLVNRAVSALRARHIDEVNVAVDDSLFTGPRTAPGWKPNYIPDGDVSPVSALSVDAGRLRPDNDPHTPDVRASDPALTAGGDVAALLVRAGIHVAGPVRRSHPTPGSATLAAVASPSVEALVTRMLQTSDNDIAESLFRHLAIARHEPATFAGGSAAEQEWLETLPVETRAVGLADGSGLSLRDRLSPRVLTAVLTRVAAAPALRPIIAALPVAGFSGTLATRFRLAPQHVLPTTGAGAVRAKTGTLTGVSALAGFVTDADGRILAFAFVADAVPLGGLLAVEAALDGIAAQLASCGCR